MTPMQTFVDGRCISPLVGSFVAFDIVKVNPFNQMIDSDHKLAGLFFKSSTRSSANTTKQAIGKYAGVDAKKLGLTLANVQIHERNASSSNNRFLPKINKLVDMVHNGRNPHGDRYRARTEDDKSSACFTKENPIFDALYELEHDQVVQNNGTAVQEDEDTAA